MAHQYVRRYDGPPSGGMAPPVLSLPSHAPQDFEDDHELFQMDSRDIILQSEEFDRFPVWLDEIDHRKVRLWTCRDMR